MSLSELQIKMFEQHNAAMTEIHQQGCRQVAKYADKSATAIGEMGGTRKPVKQPLILDEILPEANPAEDAPQVPV